MRKTAVTLMLVVLGLGGCTDSATTGAGSKTPDDVGQAAVSSSSTPPKTAPRDFPNERTTGVPQGVMLTESRSVTVFKDGKVIDGLHITGTVTVKADNVTIKRTLIENTGLYAIRVADGAENLVVEDTEIDGQHTGSAAVCCGNYTLRRVNIHDATEGPRLGSNTKVIDSYIHHLYRCAGCHIDALQTTGGSHIVIRHNNLQAYNPATDDPMNAAYQFGTEFAPVRDVLVVNNLMNGGNYTVNGGGGGTTDAAVVFRNNEFGRDFRYGPVGNLGPNVVFDDTNVWHDTGKPVSAG